MQNFQLIAQAWADEAVTTATALPPAGPMDSIMPMMPLFAIILVCYFFLLRPQQQKLQQHQSMLKSLRRGDKIVTGGGIVGSIVKLEGEDMLVVEIAENVRVKVQRAAISAVLSKPEPVANGNQPDQAKSA